MKVDGLTPRQLAVLVTVSQNEGLSQTGLVERTGIDRSTLADIVRRMQRKGLLQRRRTKEDARAYAVKLTDEGRKALRTAEPLARKVDDRILEALPDRQRLVITLRDVLGHTSGEVCEMLEISGPNQRVLLHRARASVRLPVRMSSEGKRWPGR